jgi:hypothetical protein
LNTEHGKQKGERGGSGIGKEPPRAPPIIWKYDWKEWRRGGGIPVPSFYKMEIVPFHEDMNRREFRRI